MNESEQLFYDWLIANGAQFPKLAWPSNNTKSGLRGTVAISDVETNEVMLEIPLKLMMCEPRFEECDKDLCTYTIMTSLSLYFL